MQISAIVAMSDNRVIGSHNQLPWYLPADLKHFKAITWGKPIVMGRKTYESIGRTLPGRQNIILTHDTQFVASDCTIVHSIEALLKECHTAPEIMIIGGHTLYEQMLPHVQRIYQTLIHATIEGDIYFPVLKKTEWRTVERVDYLKDEKNKFDYSFVVLEREYC